MHKTLFGMLFMGFCFLNIDGLNAEPVTGEDFFIANKGIYTITSINNQVPHSPSDLEIDFIDGQGLVIASFCTDDFCDLGFNFFEPSQTSITETEPEPGISYYEIKIQTGTSSVEYSVEKYSESIVWTQHKYTYPDGTIGDLTHFAKLKTCSQLSAKPKSQSISL